MNRVLFTMILGLLSLTLALPANAQHSRWRRGSTAQAAPTASASASVSTPPAPVDPITACASACSRQFNICIHGKSPDLQVVCGSLPECAGLSQQDFTHANAWYGSCINAVTSANCLPGCTPPKVTTTTPGTTPKTVAVTPVVNPYKRDCERNGGIYIRTEVTDNGAKTTHEECYQVKDMAKDIADLKTRVAELEKKMAAGQPVVIDSSLQKLYLQVVELTKAVNDQTLAIQQLARDAVSGFDAIKKRLDDLERRVGETERNVSNVAGRVTILETRQPGTGSTTGPAPTQTVIQKAGLPCWLGVYGQVNAAKTYDTTFGSLGGELGCSLFGSADGHRSFVLAGGGGMMPNKYFGHTLAQIHTMAGGRFRLGDKVDLLVLGGGKWYNSTTWEKGTVSQYGVWPEIRYIQDNWFAGLRVGVGVQNVAPPLPPDQMANGRNTHTPVFDGWAVLGREF